MNQAIWVSSSARVDKTVAALLHGTSKLNKGMPSSISTGAMSERASEYQIPDWIELPSDVWVLIGSHLGTRDLARASTVIKALCGVQPLAVNLGHSLTEEGKTGELVWGLKRCSRVLSAVIGLTISNNTFSLELYQTMLLKTWSFPCIKELSLDVRVGGPFFCKSIQYDNYSAYGKFLLAQMAQLQLLELKEHILPPLPLMPRLRHLTIKLYGHEQGSPSFGGAVDTIAALPALQTLSAELFFPYDYHMHNVDMDLRTCASLQAVCLVGMFSDKILLPPATKLTLDIKASGYLWASYFKAHGLHLSGLKNPKYLMRNVDVSMLSALSLHDVDEPGARAVKMCLGRCDACSLRFLSVTCYKSKMLNLTLSLPCLSTLVVHAAERLELKFADVEASAARLDTVAMQWKVSSTMQSFEDNLRAYCPKEIFAGVLGDSNQPELVPRHYVSTRQIEDVGGTGELNQIHPCTVAATACGACLEHCCPLVYPMPEP
ncbi:hypothetical protein COCOBI_16-0380 [Coccomyxa sp. Obi]|nr:hypothetical protein COCOBI_16-0380 [Coccomyxa sp. Obi]